MNSYSIVNNLIKRAYRLTPVFSNSLLHTRNYVKYQNHIFLRDITKVCVPSVLQVRKAGSFHMPYTMSHIEERILLVLKLYDKVNPDKLTLNSHFMEDLGLDSLDHVEVIIAIEDEFDFEIPEEHSYRLMRPKDIVRYVADRFDIYE